MCNKCDFLCSVIPNDCNPDDITATEHPSIIEEVDDSDIFLKQMEELIEGITCLLSSLMVEFESNS